MNRRRQSAVRERQRWRRKRSAAPRYPPNYRYLQEYEEAVIIADIARHPAEWVSAKDLRMQAPGRYSVKLQPVMQRMASRTAWSRQLDSDAGRSFGRICPMFRIHVAKERKAA